MADLNQLVTPFPSWIDKQDIILWHNVEISRNLSERKFPVTSDKDELAILYSSFSETVELIFSDYQLFSVEDTDLSERKYLNERFLIDKYILSHPVATGILLNNDFSKGLMLNSSSHFKFISTRSGMLSKELFDNLILEVSKMETVYPYAFTQRYGYLNPSPENCGTGINLTYYLRLPGFMFFGKVPELKHILKDYNLSIVPYSTNEKNLMGTGIFMISNLYSYANSYESLINNVNNGIKRLIDEEIVLREQINQRSRRSIEDKIMKTIGMLKFANSIGSMEFGASLFTLFLGAELELIPLLQSDVLKTYFSLGRAYLDLKIHQNDDLNLSEIRARELQKLLRNI